MSLATTLARFSLSRGAAGVWQGAASAGATAQPPAVLPLLRRLSSLALGSAAASALGDSNTKATHHACNQTACLVCNNNSSSNRPYHQWQNKASFWSSQKPPVQQYGTTTAAAAKAKAAAPMEEGDGTSTTTTDLVKTVATTHDLSLAESRRILHTVFDTIVESVVHDKTVKVSQFGTFSAYKSAGRKGRNPSTGADLMIPEKMRVRFRVSSHFKNAVNGES